MERTLQVLNELERDGILSRYAIGGAMGATFYIEPLLTFDLDILVLLPEAKGELLTLTPLYEALRAMVEPKIASGCGFYESRPRWMMSISPWFSAGINWKGDGRNGSRETRNRKAFSREGTAPSSASSHANP